MKVSGRRRITVNTWSLFPKRRVIFFPPFNAYTIPQPLFINVIVLLQVHDQPTSQERGNLTAWSLVWGVDLRHKSRTDLPKRTQRISSLWLLAGKRAPEQQDVRFWMRREGTQYISWDNDTSAKLDSSDSYSIVFEWRVQLGLTPTDHMLVVTKSIEMFTPNLYHLLKKGVTLNIRVCIFHNLPERQRWGWSPHS